MKREAKFRLGRKYSENHNAVPNMVKSLDQTKLASHYSLVKSAICQDDEGLIYNVCLLLYEVYLYPYSPSYTGHDQIMCGALLWQSKGQFMGFIHGRIAE